MGKGSSRRSGCGRHLLLDAHLTPTVTRRLAPRDRGQLWFGSNADSAGAASVAHGPAARRRHPPTGSREARHLRPPTGRATRAPRSRRLSDTTVVHARALCKISRPARGQWWRTDGRLRWRRAGSLQHRAPGALWSARSGASRHGRRKAVTAGSAGARSRLRKSQSNLPLWLHCRWSNEDERKN